MSSVIYNLLAGSATENINKLSFASEQMHAADLSQLRRLLSSDDSDRHEVLRSRSPYWSSATQTRMPDVNTEMSINHRSPSLMSISVGADHPWWRRPHGSFHNFTLTGTSFLSVPSHFDHTGSSRSQYFTSTNHLSCGFYQNFLLKACVKNLPCSAMTSTDWFHCRDVTCCSY